jgi:hypothetical protein
MAFRMRVAVRWTLAEEPCIGAEVDVGLDERLEAIS